MEIQSLVDIYCLSYNNPKRYSIMDNKLKYFTKQYNIYKGVDKLDIRIQENSWISSCMLGHMDMITNFYNNSTKEYAIFCEDDILIHTKFNELILSIITEIKIRKLDIVLLGYLMNYHTEKVYKTI